MTNMAERLAQIWHTKMCSVQDKVTSSAFGSSMHHAILFLAGMERVLSEQNSKVPPYLHVLLFMHWIGRFPHR